MSTTTKITSLPEQEYRDGGIHVYELTLFEGEKRGFLFRPETGIGMLLDKELCSDLRQGKPSRDLLFKMVQRGMADFRESSRKVCTCCKKGVPAFFLIDLTKKCNLACKYCIRREYAESCAESAISMERLREICRYISRHVKEARLPHFTIQPWGGEPLLELDKIIAIRKFFQDEGLNPAIRFVSNGTLLTEEIMEQLKEHRLEISISLDGNREINDLQRITPGGEGSYDMVVRGIQTLQRAECHPASTVTTITGESIGNAVQVLEHLAQDLHIRNCKLNFVNISGDHALRIQNDQIRTFIESTLDKLLELSEKGTPIVEANIRQRTLNLLERNNESICLSAGCQGGSRLISFDFDGNIFPCELIGVDTVKLGNIDSGIPLRKLLEEAYPVNPYFRDHQEERCKNCLWRYYCRGGCTSAAMIQKIDGYRADITSCTLNSIMYPLLIERLLKAPHQLEILAGRRLFR